MLYLIDIKQAINKKGRPFSFHSLHANRNEGILIMDNGDQVAIAMNQKESLIGRDRWL
jgi:hypothetical protein